MERTRKVVRPQRENSHAPFIHAWHYPFGAQSHVNVRIDADWCARSEWEQTMKILEPLGSHASWFLTTGTIEDNNLDLFDRLKKSGVEIGSHMHYHYTFQDASNNRENMKLAHEWLQQHGIECRSFVSPSAKWNPALQRIIEEMGYVYSSEFGFAHDCLPIETTTGGLQIPVHPVCPINFTTTDGIDQYYDAVIDALYRSCLPIHLYAHPHDISYMGKPIIEKIVSLPDVHVSSLLSYATWWKERRCTFDLHYQEEHNLWKIEWSGSEGVMLAISWDGLSYAVLDAPFASFRSGELPPGILRRMEPYALPSPVPIRRTLNWRSRIGQWLDLEYVVPASAYRVSTPKTLINAFLKRLHG